MKRKFSFIMAGVLCFTVLAGCTSMKDVNTTQQVIETPGSTEGFMSETAVEVSSFPAVNESCPIPSLEDLPKPNATGNIVYGNSEVEFDASNTADGYLMAKYLGHSTLPIKILITGPTQVRYTYNLRTDNVFETLPLTAGNGYYTVGAYQNITGSKYAKLFETAIRVELTDGFRSFLLPNQYVNFDEDTLFVQKAKELTQNISDPLEQIAACYQYVVETISYDKELASSVTSGYLPDLNALFEKKRGICFDYAAALTAMLRSLNIPTKLVVGYTGEIYHAWIHVYTKETGWIASVIYFDGAQWNRMDPTFASGAASKKDILRYIENDKNYVEKYTY